MRKHLFTLLKIAITVGLVVWLVEHVDWGSVLRQLVNVSWVFLGLYIFFQVLGNVISVRKWQVIAAHKGLRFGLREGFFTYLTGAFINNFLPSTIGGDTYRSLWLADKTDAKAAAFSSVLFDRFTGLWAIALGALLCTVFIGEEMFESVPLLVTLSLVAVFLVANYCVSVFFYRKPWFQRLVALIPFQKLRRLVEEMIAYATERSLWWRAVAWSVVFAFVGVGLTNYLLFLALGETIPFPVFFSVIYLVTIVSAVPISINNIGVKEWAYVAFFGLVGISVETAVTVALLSRFLQMCISFIGLPHYLTSRMKKEEALIEASS